MPKEGPRSLLITGAVGVGKTTTMEAAAALLAERGLPGAMVDIDAIRRAWPAPATDRFHEGLQLANLQAMCRNFRAAGAEVGLAAGTIEDRAARARFEEAMGVPLRVVRLAAPDDVVRERIRRRHADDPGGRDWHLARYDELTAILDAAQVEDVQVTVQGAPRDTAREVLSAAGL